MIELKIPDGLLDLKKRHRDLLKNGIKKALKNFRKAKAMCDKPKPIETEEGIYYPNYKIDRPCIYSELTDQFYICNGYLIKIDKGCSFFKFYSDIYFFINCGSHMIDLLNGKQWWSTRFKPKVKQKGYSQFTDGQTIKTFATGNIEVDCIYEEIKTGKLFCISGLKYQSHFDNTVCEITLVHSHYSSDFENIILEKKVSLEEFKTEYKKINPSQERKEMEYQHSNFMVGEYYKIGEDFVILSQEYDYDFVVYSVEHCLDRNNPIVTFKMKDGSIKSRSDLDNYIKLLNETPPRTLKLEDLNKLWANKNTGKVGRIFISVRGKVNFVSGLGVQSVIFGEYSPEEFFDNYSEATQSDIDNLTKGE